MANKKISDLTTATLALTSLLEVESAGGTSGKATATALFALLGVTKSNTTTTDPTTSSDTTAGYAVGSVWLNTSTRNLFVCTDSTSSAAVWQSLNPNKIILTTNDFWTPYPQDYTATGLCAANILRGVMFKPAQRMTVDQLGVLNNAAAAVNWKGGIWATSGLMPTGNPLVTIASMSANSVHPITTFVGSATLTLDPALWYFYADVHDGTFDKLTHQSVMNRFAGATAATQITQGSGNRGWHYSQSHTYANALPDLTSNSLTRVAALSGSAGPGVPYFRVSNVAP